MAKIFNKFLVQRRDGTVPEWPWFVLGAADPIAADTLRYYADRAEEAGMASDYTDDLISLARRFDRWRKQHHTGDPDAPAHRTDNAEIVVKIPRYATENPTGDNN
jgi:hypothetical protein